MKIVHIIVLVILLINMAIAVHEENEYAFLGWIVSILLLTLLIL